MKIAKKITAAACIALTVLVAAALSSACGSGPKASAAAPDELDGAIREASDYLNGRLERGIKIAFLNVQSDSQALSEYVIDGLIENTVNDNIFQAVDRQQLDLIRAEMDFQLSGEVSDDSAQELGRLLGAQIIVSGAVSQIADIYRLRVRALGVQSAQIAGQFSRNIPNGLTIASLMKSSASGYGGSSGGSGTQTAQAGGSGGAASGGKVSAPAAPAAPAYKVGDTGPAGGLIFYDKGNSSGGWRYLEAAPEETEMNVIWWPDSGSWQIKGGPEVGLGKTNTKELMEEFNKRGGGFDTAIRECDDLSVNGFDDWFLPSKDELNFMYGNLHRRGLGGFRKEQYWSSTVSGDSIPYLNFSDGMWGNWFQAVWNKKRVRAVRQF
ncbi:hypothetical protein FACS1894147_09570 [Spirochaetia bacterium]|nr:hypothetical protein FACS1894147_09570 [Spirochaetia bacterium]